MCKDAGWRGASGVGLWGRGAAESLVVLTDLPARGAVLARYERRYWIEPGFRNDKTRGWQGEASQVRGQAAQERRRVALAWARVVVLSVGLTAAREQLAWERQRRAAGARGQVRRAPAARRAAVGYGTARPALPWGLGDRAGPSWGQRWHRVQAQALIQPSKWSYEKLAPPPDRPGRVALCF